MRPRPIRIAFLVEEGVHSDAVLDGIFANCYGRWGGRFSLIVPCLLGRISPSYWAWIETFDPDVIYSYVPLNRNDVLELHERLFPASYIFHGPVDDPKSDFKPALEISLLSSLSTIFRSARYMPPMGTPEPIRIIDSWYTERPTRFLTDNLGTYHLSWGMGPYPPDAAAAASLLTIVSPQLPLQQRRAIPAHLTTIPDEAAAFREFAEGRATSLSLLSGILAPKLEFPRTQWSSSFNLVIGDSFADRVLFWNARLLIPNWLDSQLCCWRTNMTELRDAEYLSTLGNLLKRRNHVNAGSGGPSQLTIRSTSASTEELAEARERIQSTRPWGWCTTEAIVGLDSIAPPHNALERANETSRFTGEAFGRPEWTSFRWSPPTARPGAIAPDHLIDAPPHQAFSSGYWCADHIFAYDGPGPLIGNENQWMLPRRWRMAGAFKISFFGNAFRPYMTPPPRRSRDGNLTVFVSSDNPIDAINIPTASQAVHHALATDGAWASVDTEHRDIQPPNKVYWTDPSNEARYLTGILGMTGGLSRACDFLLHPFLRNFFAKFGGTPNLPAEMTQPTIDRLRKKVRRRPSFDLRDETERQALANLIANAARSIKKPMEFVRYIDLKSDWTNYRNEYWSARPQEAEAEHDAEWSQYEERSLDQCLIELRRGKLIFQGHQWTCSKCHHRNWVDLDALSSHLTCYVCKQASQAPVNIEWVFRANEFLIESLRDHSVLSLVWVLSALRSRARRSLVFVGPTCFGYTQQSDESDAEADLLVLVDGKCVLCEVKSSWRSLRPVDITDFTALATRLRPDIAMLAVMGSGTGPRGHLDAARLELAAYGIEFELLTSDLFAVSDDPIIHVSDEE